MNFSAERRWTKQWTRGMIRRFMNRPPVQTPPWKAGIDAARANLIPGLFVQAGILLLVLAYYFFPASRPAFDRLGGLKLQFGYFYSILSAAVAGGIFPEILRIAAFQKGRPCRNNLTNLGFTIPFWGAQGFVVDYFYHWQAIWFGSTATIGAILAKVCVDQFIYNPVYAAPFGVTLYEWRNRNWQWSHDFLSPSFYRTKIFPALLATWAFWIPTVSLVYSLPSALQVPIFSLALTCWVLLFTWISSTDRATL